MSEPLRLETPRSVEIIEVVRVQAARGLGVEGDPIRIVTQYWDGAGNFLAENDPSVPIRPRGTPQ